MANEDKNFQDLFELTNIPLVQDFIHHIGQAAGFKLPPSLKEMFDKHRRHFFDEPCPAFNLDWGTDSPNWRWQKIYMDSIFGSTELALGAALYHRDNLLRIERDLLSFPDIDQLIALLGTAAMAGGNTQKLNFEYHGFIFAYRRTLDYLARGIGALLRQNFNSFRKLPRLLERHQVNDWVKIILQNHAANASRLKSFLSEGDGKSVRDRLAHYYHVSVGSLNVNASGIFLVSDSEDLEVGRRLSVVVDDYVRILSEIIRECLRAIEVGFPKQNV